MFTLTYQSLTVILFCQVPRSLGAPWRGGVWRILLRVWPALLALHESTTSAISGLAGVQVMVNYVPQCNFDIHVESEFANKNRCWTSTSSTASANSS
jgi:hypothetical protein